jgi:hypothetical protein
VLITNKASNILQDIDSLHLFAQVVTSICKTLDEREISRHSFELLSAFDEVVSLGYRENLSLSQIRTFLEMESHEERIQEIISRNKEFEATEERKRKEKQIELQRKEMSRNQSMGGGMGGGMGGMGGGRTTPKFPTYTPPAQKIPDTYDSYEAEKKKTFSAPKGKGMQLGRKSKTTDMFEKVRHELGPEADERAPLVSSHTEAQSPVQSNFASEGTGISVTVTENLSAQLARDGNLKSFEVKGTLLLRITDSSLTKLKLQIAADTSTGAQFKTHPNVDKGAFTSQSVLQLKDTSRDFPVNNQFGVLRWSQSSGTAPISFTIWVNQGSPGIYNVTVEYELADESDNLKDVVVSIPFHRAEPTISSVDEVYEVSGDSIDWTLPHVGEDNPSGAFEFEAEAEDENEFFPMKVSFSRERPIVGVEVSPLRSIRQYLSFTDTASRSTKLYWPNWVRALISTRKLGLWRITTLSCRLVMVGIRSGE